MVKIKNLEEFRRIQDSDFGYILSIKKNLPPTIHQPKCKSLKEEDFELSLKENSEFIFYWFSSISRAEKEMEGIVTCKNCNS